MDPTSLTGNSTPTHIYLENRSSVLYSNPSDPTQVLKLFHTNSPEAYQEAEMHRIASAVTIGVVGFVDIYIEEGRLGIVMEACQLENVGQMYPSLSRRWEERELLGIIRDMMKIVASLHSAGIVHGNLGLDNWLINHNCCLRLTDFGNAKHTSDREFQRDISQLGRNLYEMALLTPCRYSENCAEDLLLHSMTSKVQKLRYSRDLVDLIFTLMRCRQTLQWCIDFATQRIRH